MKKILFAALSLVLAGAIPALSAEKTDKFTQMDTDNNNAVTWEEFQKAYPKMQKAAFESIDADKSGTVSRQEWETFLEQHQKGMSGGQGMGKAPAGMGGGAAPEGMPMITPPSK